jgi:hypothetical protein
MKQYLKPKYLPYAALVLGGLAFLCGVWLYTTGVDQRALLIPGHPGAIGLWVLSAVMVVLSILLTRELSGKMRYERAFPASIPAAVGTALCAAGIAITAFGELTAKTDVVTTVTGAVGLLAAVALGFVAWCRFAQVRPHFLPMCAVVAYLMMHMLCRYRVWSAEPELLRYFFALAGTVLLTLAMYQRLAFAVGLGNRQIYTLLSMVGAFCALAAIPGDGDKWFLVGMAAWAMTDLCNLNLRKRRRKTEAA